MTSATGVDSPLHLNIDTPLHQKDNPLTENNNSKEMRYVHTEKNVQEKVSLT